MIRREDVKEQDKEISKLLMSLAKGCKVAEVIEEYTEVDGQMRLTKRKETRRDIPPDLKALQMLLEGGTEMSGWTDEQLEAEKARLMSLFKKEETTKKKQRKSKPNKQGGEV